MKWVCRFGFLLLIALTAVSAFGSIYYYLRVNSKKNDENNLAFPSYPVYFFSLIINTEDDVYWESFKEGVSAAAKEYNVAIEDNEVTEPDSNSEMEEYIFIAEQSKMDGIIVAGDSNDEYDVAIAEAIEAGINVVMGDSDISDSSSAVYVGTNNYEYGENAAEMIEQLCEEGEKLDLAVILSDKNCEYASLNPSTQLMINGLGKGPFNFTSTLYRTSDLLGAEDQIRATLSAHPDIDVIFCTNDKDTISAAHVIIERNLVGKVHIVGTGVTDEIVDYIKKGVIFGVLDRKGYDAGYSSVKILYESMGSSFRSNYMDISPSAYTVDNISTYVKP